MGVIVKWCFELSWCWVNLPVVRRIETLSGGPLPVGED